MRKAGSGYEPSIEDLEVYLVGVEELARLRAAKAGPP